MPVLSDAEIAGIRTDLEVLLVHRCTITPMLTGPEDPEGNRPLVPGTPATNVPCTYGTIASVRRDEGGTTVVHVPGLMLSASLGVEVGDRVEAITDQLGVVLNAGPLRLERLLDDTAGLGAPLLPVFELRAGEAVA